MTDGEKLAYMGTDAAKWAAEFCKVARDLGHGDLDEGWVLGWFACAIEAGRGASMLPPTSYAGPVVGGPCDGQMFEGQKRALCVPVDEGDGWWVAEFIAASIAAATAKARDGWPPAPDDS